MVKDILLVVENSAHANPLIRFAVKIAERMAADLTIEILTPNPVLIPALASMTAMYIPEWTMDEEQAARIKKVSTMVAGSTASIRVLGLHDDIRALVRRAGRAGPIADMVIVGGEALWETQWLRLHVTETIVMGTGAPVLILPKGKEFTPVQNAVLGWKDGPEARRALSDLVMLAEPAANVTVVTIGGYGDEEKLTAQSGADVVRHLVRHGLRAEWIQLRGNVRPDAETLEDFALKKDTDLLAIGAFGHSRVRDIVFGGVTRSLLNKSRLPILLSR